MFIILQVMTRIKRFFSGVTTHTTHDPLRRLQLSLLTLLLLMFCGTLVYMALEGWTLLEALYMTVITIATVGFAGH